MTYMAAKAYLTTHKPPIIQSAQDFGAKFRIANRTTTDMLKECGYRYEDKPGYGMVWVLHVSQLDRIERKLDALLKILRAATINEPEGSAA